MKTQWYVYFLWSVLSLCIVSTYESTSVLRRRKIFTLDAAKPTYKTRLERKSTRSFTVPPLLRSEPGTPGSGPEAKIGSGFAHLPDVSVSCSASDVVVRVRPAFYGLRAKAEELKLGGSCESKGVLRPSGDLLFTYPLTRCEVRRELSPGYLVYKFVLHYEPSPKRFPSRAHRIDIDIECCFHRYHHVSQLAVRPTWQTAIMRKRLRGHPKEFQIQLMDDLWSRLAKSQVYQLGQTVNFQVSAPHIPAGGKLYINSCYAKPSNDTKSSLRYSIIDNSGCMLDSRRDPGASQFISRTDKTLRFSLNAFQFISDPDAEVQHGTQIFLFHHPKWKALTGDDSICECCDSQCVTSKPRRAMMEGSAISGLLLVSDQPHTPADGFLLISPSPVRREKELKVEINMSHQTDDLYNYETLWGSPDVVEYDDDAESEKGYTEEEELEAEESSITFEVETEPNQYLNRIARLLVL
ncbi:hypothetical protein LDENG_00222220 [Lucifuga dentata]|nr:hypothetical protein LDENG_00222220 [Lucifuga dentata]